MSRKRRRTPFHYQQHVVAERSKSVALPRWFMPLFVLGVLALAGLYIALASHSLPIIDHTDPKLVEEGRRIYSAECAACHGANLEGQPNWASRLPNGRLPAPPHDQSGHTWHHSDRALFNITKRGPAAYPGGYVTDMPAFGNRLTDGQIAAVLAYIKSTWPKDIQDKQARSNAGVRQ